MSVYDDIRTLIRDEQREVVEQVQAADRVLAEAEEAHSRTIDPLQKRLADLNHLDDETKALAEAAATPVPTSPTVPESDESSIPTPASTDSSPVSVANPSSESSSPSEPQSDSPSTEPAAPVIPSDAIALADAPDAIAAGAPASTPVAVPTSTGEIAVVTVDDVIVAADPAVADADLTPAQQVVRNSDLP